MNINNRLKSQLLVIGQFMCLGLMAITASPIAKPIIPLALEIIGIGIGVWAILTMGIGKFNIVPDPQEDSQLTTTGPYHFIRHPMYTSILVTCLGLLVSDFSIVRLVIYSALVLILLIKIQYEESLLVAHLAGYSEYQQRTKRIIPFIF